MLGLVLLTKPARVSPVSAWEVVEVVEDKANQRLDEFARGARVSAPLPIWNCRAGSRHCLYHANELVSTQGPLSQRTQCIYMESPNAQACTRQ